LNGVFTSAFENYQVVVNFNGSTGQDVTTRLRVGGTDSSAASYSYRRVAAGATYGTTASASGTSFHVGVGRATNRSIISITFGQPQVSQQTTMTAAGWEPDGLLDLSGGTFLATTTFDGFTLIPSAGNITGTIRVYGYQNS
jgi:hypothetical protein